MQEPNPKSKMKINNKALFIRFRLFQLTINTVILIAVFCFALLFGKMLECIIVLMSYFLLRYRFDKTFHSANMWVCVALSILMCWGMIAVTLPISISILSGIVIAMIDCYILYIVRDYFDIRSNLMETIKLKSFNVDTCTEAELLERCREVHLSQENTELAIEFFIKKTKQSDLADKLCINEKSVQIRKKRLRKKLNNND